MSLRRVIRLPAVLVLAIASSAALHAQTVQVKFMTYNVVEVTRATKRVAQ